jgi:hypothetical protein
MRKLGLAVGGLVVVVALALAAAVMFNQPPFDPAAYQSYLQPSINPKPDQRVLEVTMQGTPAEIAGPSIGLLYKTLRAVQREYPEAKMAAPRARWPKDVDTPQKQWIGRFALPLPDRVLSLPAGADGAAQQLRVTTWVYGDTAEILHIGSYSTEDATIAKLKQYIADQGYEIIGEHEEEYLKGPGMFFAGDPAGYYTMIRYPVKKLAPPKNDDEDEGDDDEGDEDEGDDDDDGVSPPVKPRGEGDEPTNNDDE